MVESHIKNNDSIECSVIVQSTVFELQSRPCYDVFNIITARDATFTNNDVFDYTVIYIL